MYEYVTAVYNILKLFVYLFLFSLFSLLQPQLWLFGYIIAGDSSVK